MFPELRDYLESIKALYGEEGPPIYELSRSLKEAGWNDDDIAESILYLTEKKSAVSPVSQISKPLPITPIIKKEDRSEDKREDKREEIQKAESLVSLPTDANAPSLRGDSTIFPKIQAVPQNTLVIKKTGVQDPLRYKNETGPMRPVISKISPAPGQTPGQIVKPKRRFFNAKIIAAVAVLILAGGGGAYAWNIGLTASMPFDENTVVSDIVSVLKNSAGFSYSGTFNAELSKSSRFRFDVSLAGSIEGRYRKGGDAEVNLESSLNLNGNRGNVGVSLVTLSGGTYIKIMSLPFLEDLILSYKDKWVKIEPEKISDYLPISDISNSASVNLESDNFTDEFALFITNAADAVEVSSPAKRVWHEGRYVYKYNLRINFSKLAGSIISEKARSFLGDDGSNSLTIFVDPMRKVPISMEYKDSFGEINLSFENVGADLDIRAPEAVSFDEIFFSLSGLTRESYLLYKQSSNIENIRFALEYYRELTGSYPGSLGALRAKPHDLTSSSSPKVSASTYALRFLKDEYILPYVPRDVYLREEIGYVSSGKDYELKYHIVIPAINESDSDDLYTIEFAKSWRLVPKYINGLNTATSKSISKEAVEKSKIDSDKDGIPDWFETYYGTDPSKADSDGDKISDLDEIRSVSR